MKKLSTLAVAVGAFLVAVLATPAFAQSPFTFVSESGTDAGFCATPATACRSFNFAISKTNAGGEIRALTPGNYFPVAITKSIKLHGGEGVGIHRGTAGPAINVDTPAAASVEITGVSMDGSLGVAGNDGVRFIQAGQLTIRNCVIRNMKDVGVVVQATGAARVLIEDTLVEGSGVNNISFTALPPGASIAATLNRVTSTRGGGAGFFIDGSLVKVDIANSVFSDNGLDGIRIVTGAMSLSRSVSVRNAGQGADVVPAATARSAGDNFIDGNAGGDVAGTLTAVPRL